jgi:hypothetical protein
MLPFVCTLNIVTSHPSGGRAILEQEMEVMVMDAIKTDTAIGVVQSVIGRIRTLKL